MKKIFIFLFIITHLQLSAQLSSEYILNIKDFGAVGNGIKDDFDAINNAIEFASKIIVREKNKIGCVTLYFSPGTYKIGKPIKVPKMVNLAGEINHRSVLKVDNIDSEAIIITNNEIDKINNVTDYNLIKDLVIEGPDKGKDPFVWKNIKRNNPSSVGIRVEGVRNRIENCVIDGFLWAGIEINKSYANFITDCFIKNNRIGIVVSNTSTTSYINNNEIRLNAIGVHIKNQSFSNFINNNLIEANISNYLEAETNISGGEIVSKGKAILIENSMMNYINNNFFEQHFVSVTLSNSYKNSINNNFIAVGATMQNFKKNQVILLFSNGSTNNIISENNVLTSSKSLDPYIILFDDANTDYSTNLIDFGKEPNLILKNKLISSTFKTNMKNIPLIP